MTKLTESFDSDWAEQVSFGVTTLVVLPMLCLLTVSVIDLVSKIGSPVLESVLGWRWS